ncbi:MAG: peptidase M15 [Rhodovulum sulfidophilum]|uniref:Peptidase M15 n=1 Tax=Rhodovulum sulfidophilum TaxID=35806 RepID=A0A2W5NAV9_RHOSU|nr:MAG: peptidase M15 [Rhodovulum sulfidophilum]
MTVGRGGTSFPFRLGLLHLAASLTLLSGAAQAEPAQPFLATVEPISADRRARMTGISWQEGCPVAPEDLRVIHMPYLGFDGAVHMGALVVHARVAEEVADIFEELFTAGFQIERMRPYEDYAIGEYAAHDDTAGFYCRPAQDDPGELSWHAYGLAVDLNPMTNPFLDPKEGWWPKGSDGDRDRSGPGLVHPSSEVVAIFMRHGWAWGGIDADPDFMHFAKITIGPEANPLERPVWADKLRDAPR